MFKRKTQKSPPQHVALVDDESGESVRLCDKAIGNFEPASDPTAPVCRHCVDALIAVAEDMKNRIDTIVTTVSNPGPAPDLYTAHDRA